MKTAGSLSGCISILRIVKGWLLSLDPNTLLSLSRPFGVSHVVVKIAEIRLLVFS